MKRKPLIIVTLLVVVGLAAYLVTTGNDAAAPTPAKNSQAAVSNSGKTEPASFDKTKYSLTDPASEWVVVNKTRPLDPVSYAPTDLTDVGNGKQMRAAAAAELKNMIADAATENLKITPLSAYRSYEYQVQVYGREVSANGQAQADSESARPGTSEHQTGWAVDVGGGGCGIENCFGDTAEGKWVAANAYKYGYLIRYTAAKQSITGYRAEPWHIRYIGTELSKELHKDNVTTLEEFFGLPAAPDYSKS